MTKEERLSLFQTELSYITSPAIATYAEQCLADLPEYFFHLPASSSGKYHPAFAQGEGGLVRHTKAAVRIFHNFCEKGVEGYYRLEDPTPPNILMSASEFHDCGVVALLIHDGLKYGNTYTQGDPTKHEHPLLASQFAMEEAKKVELPYEIVRAISLAVSTHMGRFTVSKYSSVILPHPDMSGWLGKMVSISDIMAAYKPMNFEF